MFFVTVADDPATGLYDDRFVVIDQSLLFSKTVLLNGSGVLGTTPVVVLVGEIFVSFGVFVFTTIML